jgi:hypothetical protein
LITREFEGKARREGRGQEEKRGKRGMFMQSVLRMNLAVPGSLGGKEWEREAAGDE